MESGWKVTKLGGAILVLFTLLAGGVVYSDLHGTDDLRGVASVVVVLIYVPTAMAIIAVDYIARSVVRFRRLSREVERRHN
jgi:hypothetical protein